MSPLPLLSHLTAIRQPLRRSGSPPEVPGAGEPVAVVAAESAWGRLAQLLARPGVSDVLVNPDASVWLDDGAGLRRLPQTLGTTCDVHRLAVHLAGMAGRRLDDAVPWVDGRLPGGVRLHAVVPPAAPQGAHLSLRVVGGRRFDLAALVALRCVPPDWAPLLERLVTARRSMLVSGSTGAGKTTVLGAMLSVVPADERVVLVEDVAELDPDHPHVVRLEARQANVEGAGEIDLAALVRQALRMRPDRLVVGECRGPEVRDLLAAFNTGHAGVLGTVHANGPAQVPARLQALGALAGLEPSAVDRQVVAGLDVVAHLERVGGRRAVRQIAVVDVDPAGAPVVVPALDTVDGEGPGLDALLRSIGEREPL